MTAPGEQERDKEGPSGRRWLALALAWSAQAAGAAVFLGLPAIGPQFASEYRMGLASLSIAFAALMLGAGLSVLPWGSLADRIGERRVMVAGLALAALALGLAAVAPATAIVAPLLVLAGMGSASANAASSRSVLAWFPIRERGLAMGIRQTALPVGGATAAVTLPALANALSVPATLGVLGAVCALTAAAVGRGLKSPGASTSAAPQPGPRRALLADRKLRRVVVASALLAAPQLALASFLVVFLEREHGWTLGDAAALLAVIQLAGAAARPIVGRWSDSRQDRAGLMAGVALVTAVALLDLSLASTAPTAPLVASLVLAGVASLSWNGLAALAAGELAPPGRAGAALGWQTSAVFVGGAATVPLFAALVAATSWSVAFAALALPTLLGAVAVWPLRRRHRLHTDRERELMRRALASMNSAIALIDLCDPAQPLVYVNAAFERLTQYSAAEVIGRPWTLLEGPDTDRETAAMLRDAVAQGQELRVPIRHHRRDGQAYWSELLMAPVYEEDNSVTHYMAVAKDVTERMDAEERAVHLAYHDTITGLPNRAQLQEHLELALARADRGDTSAALLFLDLDGFKEVNDRYGHKAGDQVLADVATRWRAIARRGDVLARYGGDEFVLLMADLRSGEARETAEATGRRYVDALRLPFDVAGASSGQVTEIGVSVGASLYPDDASSPSALLLAADEAMYVAKRAARANR